MISRFLVPQMFLGLFLRKLEVQDFRKLAESLPWRLPELDGQPQIAAEVPKNAPPDAIRARFSSADQRKVLEVAPAKLQFRMLPGELIEQSPGGQKGLRPGSLTEAFDTFIPAAMKIHSVFSEHFGATAIRIGLLTELFVPIGASSNQRMQKALLSNANHFGDRLQEIQIQALSRPVLDGERSVNRWIRVKPLRSSDERNADLAMGVEVDINTLPEDSYDLTTADIENFLRNVKSHIEEKIPLFRDTALFEE